MGPIECTEMSVNYHATLRNMPEERIFPLHRDGSLKSQVLRTFACMFISKCTVTHQRRLKFLFSYTRQESSEKHLPIYQTVLHHMKIKKGLNLPLQR
jgi:hypothetical protein